MSLEFEGDEEKARMNRARHGVTFEEAKTVFNDPFALTISDPDHSDEEGRGLDIGLSAEGRLLVVWYIERGILFECTIATGWCRNTTSLSRKARSCSTRTLRPASRIRIR